MRTRNWPHFEAHTKKEQEKIDRKINKSNCSISYLVNLMKYSFFVFFQRTKRERTCSEMPHRTEINDTCAGLHTRCLSILECSPAFNNSSTMSKWVPNQMQCYYVSLLCIYLNSGKYPFLIFRSFHLSAIVTWGKCNSDKSAGERSEIFWSMKIPSYWKTAKWTFSYSKKEQTRQAIQSFVAVFPSYFSIDG